MSVKVDTSSLEKGIKRALTAIGQAALKGVNDVANEILRLGTFEVPHDVGTLQSSGNIDPDTDQSVIVGYNTPYAARLHEHPEYRFQKGRKGKYLEDPIKNNLSVFKQFIQNSIVTYLK